MRRSFVFLLCFFVLGSVLQARECTYLPTGNRLVHRIGTDEQFSKITVSPKGRYAYFVVHKKDKYPLYRWDLKNDTKKEIFPTITHKFEWLDDYLVEKKHLKGKDTLQFTHLDTGKLKILPVGGWFSSVMQQGNHIVVLHEVSVGKVLDILDRDTLRLKKRIHLPEGIYSVYLSSDKNELFFINKNQTLYRIDLNTNQVAQTPIPNYGKESWSARTFRNGNAVFKVGEQFLVYLKEDNKLYQVPLGDYAKQHGVHKLEKLFGPYLSSDGGHLLVETGNSSKHRIWWADIKKGKMRLVDEKTTSPWYYPSPTTNQLLFMKDSKLQGYDFATGEKTVVDDSNRYHSVMVTNGREVLTYWDEDILTLQIKDSQTGKRVKSKFTWPTDDRIKSFKNSPILWAKNGWKNVVLMDSEDGSQFVTHSQNYADKVIGKEDVRVLLTQEETRLLVAWETDRICVPIGNIIPRQKPEKKDSSLHTEIQKSELSALAKFHLCSLPFSEQVDAWEKVAPSRLKNPLTKEKAIWYLMRFQKPEGFDPNRHLPILYSILETQYRSGGGDPMFPELLIRNALQGVLYRSELLYEELLKRFPKLVDLPQAVQPRVKIADCLTGAEKTQYFEMAKKYLDKLVTQAMVGHKFNHWGRLLPLASFLKELPEDDRDDYIATITENLEQRSSKSPYRHVFKSKLHYLILEGVKPLFGQKSQVHTDFTMAREWDPDSSTNNVTAFILGTRPIKNRGYSEVSHDLGFFVKQVGSQRLSSDLKPGDSILEIHTNWTLGTQHFNVKAKAKSLPRRELVKAADQPPYPDMLHDKKLTGLIVLGTYMTSKSGEYRFKNYADFIENSTKAEGFEWKKKDVFTDNYPALFAEKIVSGEADYVFDADHSGGQLNDVCQLSLTTQYWVGERPLGNGLREVIYLFKRGDRKAAKVCSNQSYADLLRKRHKNGGGPILIVGGKCNTQKKQVRVTQLTGEPILIPIPTVCGKYPFDGEADHPMARILDGVRHLRKYAAMRIEGPPDTDNPFIFPDQKRYKVQVIDLMKFPVQIDNQIFTIHGGTKRPYRFRPQLKD